MFMVLWSYQAHCQSSLGSFDECRQSANPQTKPTDFGFGRPQAAILYTHRRHLLL